MTEKKEHSELVAKLRTYKFDAFVEKNLKRAEHGINDALCSIPSIEFEDAVGYRILDKLQEMIGGDNVRSILERYLETEIKEDEENEEE